MYDLTNVIDTDAVSSIRPGSTILVAGPAMTGKEELAKDVLADGSEDGQGSVIVTTGDDAQNVIDDYRTRVSDLDEALLGVVDCRGEGGRSSDQTSYGSYVHHVSSPGDVTGIGIGITKSLESLHNNGADAGRFALMSLSTMLTYTDKKTVFKFCHVLSSRFDAADYIGLFTIDTGAHEDQTIQVIKQAFDGMIELRESDDGVREVRVVGLEGQPSDWQKL
jgi:KaiC/GvpD/RAD55 family RecA-like ATPase